MKTPDIHPLPRACAAWAQRLGARNAGDLSRAEWAALQDHLAGCANCRAVYAAYREVDAALLRLPAVEPSAEQVASLRALVNGQAGREVGRRAAAPVRERPRERARVSLAARIGLTAVLVVLLGGFYGLFTLYHPASPLAPQKTTTSTLPPSHVIYAVSDTGTVFAVNADTGKMIWSTALHVQASEQFVVAGGKIFLGDNNEVLYALQASNGRLIWSHSYKALTTVGNQAVQIAPYPASDGRALYFGTPTGIYAWNASDGQTLWSFPVTQACQAQDVCAPSVATVSNGVVYAYLGGLYALQASDGKKLWQAAQVPDDTPLVVAQNNVFVGGNNTPVSILQAATGKPLDVPGLAQINAPQGLLTNGSVVFVQNRGPGVSNMQVYGVRASDGKVLWMQEYYNGQGLAGALGNEFFFTSISQDTFTQTTPVSDPTGSSQQEYAGYLCEASALDGSMQWCLQLLGNFTPQLQVARNGILYATTLGGVEAVRVSDGKQLWFALDSVTLADIVFI